MIKQLTVYGTFGDFFEISGVYPSIILSKCLLMSGVSCVAFATFAVGTWRSPDIGVELHVNHLIQSDCYCFVHQGKIIAYRVSYRHQSEPVLQS